MFGICGVVIGTELQLAKFLGCGICIGMLGLGGGHRVIGGADQILQGIGNLVGHRVSLGFGFILDLLRITGRHNRVGGLDTRISLCSIRPQIRWTLTKCWFES